MKKQMRVLVTAATIAIGLSSSIAHAAFVNYEFIDEINSDGRLTGTFQFDDSTNLFGAVDIQVTFDGGHVATFGAQNGSIPGSAGGNPSAYAYIFFSGAGSLSSAGTANDLFINATALQFTTPISGVSGFLDWSAQYVEYGPASERLPTVFPPIDSVIIGAIAPTRYDASPSGVSRTAFSRVAVAAVPEPSTYAMMAIGLLGIAGMRRRQNTA